MTPKIAYLVAGFSSDLQVALGYLRLRKSISDMSEIRQAGSAYVCTVKIVKPFDEIARDISARFGRFVRLRKE